MQYRDRLVEAHLALVELVCSRVITQPIRIAAETLKSKIEAELGETGVPDDLAGTAA